MFFLNIFVRRFLKENNYGSFSETIDKKKDEIFQRNVRTGKYGNAYTQLLFHAIQKRLQIAAYLR